MTINMKTLGLDVGDVWIGTALSDGAGISCRPYQTVTLNTLEGFLKDLLANEQISTVVVGHPITVGGGKVSAQTEKVEALFAVLKEQFAAYDLTWVLWDERFSTKRAQTRLAQTTQQHHKKKKEAKKREHSIAAAFILQNYLDSKAFHH